MRTAPTNPLEAARELWQIGEDLDTVTEQLIEMRKQRSEMERAHRTAYARTFLSLDGSVEIRRQKSILAADEARFQLDVCDQKIESCKERLRTLRDRSEITRSINSNLKEELRTLGDRP